MGTLITAHYPGVTPALFPCSPYLQSERGTSARSTHKAESNNSFVSAHQRGSCSLALPRTPPVSGSRTDLPFPLISIRDSISGLNVTPPPRTVRALQSEQETTLLLPVGSWGGGIQKRTSRLQMTEAVAKMATKGCFCHSGKPPQTCPACLCTVCTTPSFPLPHRRSTSAALNPAFSLFLPIPSYHHGW